MSTEVNLGGIVQSTNVHCDGKRIAFSAGYIEAEGFNQMKVLT